MKVFKHYFDKNDTPFDQRYQANKKYHTAWKHYTYSRFLGHKVVKIKLFGLITIYNRKKSQDEIFEEIKNLVSDPEEYYSKSETKYL